MSDADFAVVSDGAGDAEALETFANVVGSLDSVFCSFFEGDGSTYNVCPFSVFEANHLSLLTGFVRVETCFFTNFVGFFDGSDTVCVQTSKNLLDATVLRFELNFSKHNNSSLFLVLTGID